MSSEKRLFKTGEIITGKDAGVWVRVDAETEYQEASRELNAHLTDPANETRRESVANPEPSATCSGSGEDEGKATNE